MPLASVPALTSFLNDEWRTETYQGLEYQELLHVDYTLGDRAGRLIGAPEETPSRSKCFRLWPRNGDGARAQSDPLG